MATRKAAATQPKRKRGRPPKIIDPQMVRVLASYGCTRYEIAHVIGVHENTLRRRNYAGIIEEGEAIGRTSLRQTRHQIAEAGNVPMLIHLSKHRLHEKDGATDILDGATGKPSRTLRIEFD